MQDEGWSCFQVETVATFPSVDDVLSYKTNLWDLENSRKALWNPGSLSSLEGEREKKKKSMLVSIWETPFLVVFAAIFLQDPAENKPTQKV